MVIQREQYRIIMSKEWQDRINNSCCPVCGKPKRDWTRRVDWTCCSTDCTTTYSKEVIYGWSQLKEKVFKRDNHVCVKCGKTGGKMGKYQNNDKGLVADHIIPIAIGGEQWNIDNIQSLCIDCDKIKTKQDQADIGKARRNEKLVAKGQTFLPICQLSSRKEGK